MKVFRKVWPFIILLLWFIHVRNTRSQTQTCDEGVQVIRVCTDGSLISQVTVNIDTVSVPKFPTITCTCVISPSRGGETFVLEYSGKTDEEHTWFKLNNLVLNKTSSTYKTDINYGADLIFFNMNDSTIPSACLNVFTENGSTFNITCLRNTIPTTTDLITPKTSSSGGITSVTDVVVEPDRNRESKPDMIIPVVAAAASVVCLAFVVALGVFCRRRSRAGKEKSKTSTAVVEKEKEDDYYMTENPMYNVTDTEPDKQSDEREYHYIKAENQGDGMPDCQYESIPDSPVTGQLPDKDLHYDYTRCASTKVKSGPVLANRVNQNKSENKKISEQESIGDTMYDRTDTAAAKTFLSVNDYHHISPAASRKRVVTNTYNTCGEANEGIQNKIIDEDSEYHFTN